MRVQYATEVQGAFAVGIRSVLGALLAALALFGLLGCSSSNLSPIEELAGEPSQSDEEYQIQAGDVLEIQVWGEPRLSGEVLVRDNGKLTLPLINEVKAEGLTSAELKDTLSKELSEFIPAASVTVIVKHTAPTRYFLSGQFMKPGEYRSDKKITFLQAIATGGGFAPFADDSSIILIRRAPTGELRYELDYSRVVDGREPNPILRNGDIIAVR